MQPAETVRVQRAFFATGQTREYAFRRTALEKFKAAIVSNESAIFAALKTDMHRPKFESYTSEVAIVIDEIDYAIKSLRCWMKPKRTPTPIVHFISKSRIYPEPKGVTLIISPWNYPFQLLFAPLVASIAAGNTAVLKPSELAPATASVIAKITAEAFQPEHVAVVEGGIETSQALLREQWDHIFFTGGTAVGKVVMKAAAENLTPVTLELGGKSPCIVDEDYPIEQAARRIVWGKFYNAGQTCIAPDYVLVHQSQKAALIEKMTAVIREFYGADPEKSPDYARIINDRHFGRLMKLMNSGKAVAGGVANPTTRYIAPTLLEGVKLSDPVMQEEIFGPVLPIIVFANLKEAVAIIEKNPKPLALYLFTRNKTHEEQILSCVQFGGGCINDCLIHIGSSKMPFGGIGPSGLGAYHGKTGFDVFSHHKSIVKKTSWFDVKLRYPPYSEKTYRLIRKIF